MSNEGNFQEVQIPLAAASNKQKQAGNNTPRQFLGVEEPQTPAFLSINSQGHTPERPRRQQQTGVGLRDLLTQKLMQRKGINSPLVSLLAADGSGSNGPQPQVLAQTQIPQPPSLFAASYAQ